MIMIEYDVKRFIQKNYQEYKISCFKLNFSKVKKKLWKSKTINSFYGSTTAEYQSSHFQPCKWI